MRLLLITLLLAASVNPSPAGWGPGGCAVAAPVWSPSPVQVYAPVAQPYVVQPSMVQPPAVRAPDARPPIRLARRVPARTPHCLCSEDKDCGCLDGRPCVCQKPKCCDCCDETRDCGCQKGKTCTCTAPANYGLCRERLSETPRYVLNGKEVPRRKAFEALEGPGDKNLVDDSGKLRLTVISADKATRKKVADDMTGGDKALTDFVAKNALWQSYDAADLMVTKPGFVTGGQPTVYCQTPAGKVLHRQDDYAGGAPALYAALRDARADYDPAKDPDLRAGPVVPAPAPSPVNPAPNGPSAPVTQPSAAGLLGVGALALLMLLYTRKSL